MLLAIIYLIALVFFVYYCFKKKDKTETIAPKSRMIQGIVCFIVAFISFIILFKDYLGIYLIDAVRTSSLSIGLIMPIVWIFCGIVCCVRGATRYFMLVMVGAALTMAGLFGFGILGGVIDNMSNATSRELCDDISRIIWQVYNDMPEGDDKDEVKSILSKGVFLDDLDCMPDSFMSDDIKNICYELEGQINDTLHKGEPKIYLIYFESEIEVYSSEFRENLFFTIDVNSIVPNSNKSISAIPEEYMSDIYAYRPLEVINE